MTNIDLLQEAVNAGIINLDSVQEQIDMKKKEKILKEHSYSIWEGKDGKWRTYVFDETKAKNRRLIKRKTKEDIEDFIVEEYDTNHKGVNETTIKTLYPEWLQYKYLKVNSPNTIKRIQNDWERFYDNDHYNQEHDTDIINIPIQELSKLKLDKWAHHMVKFGNAVPSKSIRHKRKDMRSNMTKKQYYGVSLIAREILDYAVDNGIIDKNYFDQIKIDKRLYRKVLKKKSENEVFLVNEVNDIIHLAWKDFEEHPSNLTILAIILNFYMGTRVGELVVLKTSDIEKGNYLHVQHQLVKNYDMTNITDPKFIGYIDVPYTKSDAGDRYIYLVSEAIEVLDVIMKTRDMYYSNTKDYEKGYLFIKNGKRISHNQIEQLLRKYCMQLGICSKSNHKIRKTFISTLYDNGVNINTIREMVGHEDEKTTLRCYIYDRFNDSDIENMLENALSQSNIVTYTSSINHFATLSDLGNHR